MNEKALRGYILDFLKRIYPAEVEELNVIATFYEYWTEQQIKRALAYLVDKGYIEKTERKHPVLPRRKLHFYRLTAKGIDLLERTVEDNGIITPEGANVS
jgi:DNA-binding PadR family transcriptional regulator